MFGEGEDSWFGGGEDDTKKVKAATKKAKPLPAEKEIKKKPAAVSNKRLENREKKAVKAKAATKKASDTSAAKLADSTAKLQKQANKTAQK